MADRARRVEGVRLYDGERSDNACFEGTACLQCCLANFRIECGDEPASPQADLRVPGCFDQPRTGADAAGRDCVDHLTID